jgi:phage-related protein
MPPKWGVANTETIKAEFIALPDRDEAKLLSLMEHYETVGFGNPSPAQIDDYGDGIYRLRHIKPAYQGRLIFFAVERVAGLEKLVVLTVFKKQSQDVPQNVLDRARVRMAEYRRRQGK